MAGALDQGTHGWWWLVWVRAAAAAQGANRGDVGWCRWLLCRRRQLRLKVQTEVTVAGASGCCDSDSGLGTGRQRDRWLGRGSSGGWGGMK